MSLEIQGHGVKGAIQVVQGFQTLQKRQEIVREVKDVRQGRQGQQGAAYPPGAKGTKAISKGTKARSRATRPTIPIFMAVSYFSSVFPLLYNGSPFVQKDWILHLLSWLDLGKKAQGGRNHAGIASSNIFRFLLPRLRLIFSAMN
jgi:hypothetical protein